MDKFSIILAFTMGLMGSLHCVGMCGPIIWVMPFQRLDGLRRILGILLYHFGRVTIYAFLAILLHSFSGFFKPQVQQYVSILLGATLIILGLMSFLPNPVSITLPWTGFVKKQLASFMGHPGIGALFITGMLNGLLPCGLVYMALSASLSIHNTLNAALLMYSFGLGTMPMLVTLTILRRRASFLKFDHLKKIIPLTTLSFGLFIMVRGMDLGIPYLSPKVQVTQHGMKACCCHKNTVELKFK